MRDQKQKGQTAPTHRRKETVVLPEDMNRRTFGEGGGEYITLAVPQAPDLNR